MTPEESRLMFELNWKTKRLDPSDPVNARAFATLAFLEDKCVAELKEQRRLMDDPEAAAKPAEPTAESLQEALEVIAAGMASACMLEEKAGLPEDQRKTIVEAREKALHEIVAALRKTLAEKEKPEKTE